MSTSLVPVVARQVGDDTIPTVNARELHAFLEVGKVFAAWIKARIEQYDFVEGRDFVVIAGLSVPESESSKARQQRMLDYHLTIAMAKELSMVERNAKGKQAREYFIECERVALNKTPALPAPEAAPNLLAEQAAGIATQALVQNTALIERTCNGFGLYAPGRIEKHAMRVLSGQKLIF